MNHHKVIQISAFNLPRILKTCNKLWRPNGASIFMSLKHNCQNDYTHARHKLHNLLFLK